MLHTERHANAVQDHTDHITADLEIPQEAVDVARRMAAKAARRGWGDIDELESAAMHGAWRAMKVAAQKADFYPDDLGAWVSFFVKDRIRHIRVRNLRRLARPTLLTGRCESLGDDYPDTKTPDPSAKVERDEFWQLACSRLSDRHAEAVRLCYRDGYTLKDAGLTIGINANVVAERLARGIHKVVAGLRPLRVAG